MKWYTHMDALEVRLLSKFYMLRNDLSGGLKRVMYFALCESLIKYGLSIWRGKGAVRMLMQLHLPLDFSITLDRIVYYKVVDLVCQ